MKCELRIHAKGKYQDSSDDSLGKLLWKGLRSFLAIPRKGDIIDVHKQVGKYDDQTEFEVVRIVHKEGGVLLYALERGAFVCSQFDKSQPEDHIPGDD